MASFIRLLGRIVSSVIGDFHWSPPLWLGVPATVVTAWARNHQRILKRGIPITLAILILGLIGYNWYQSQPHPERFEVSGTPPGLTPLRDGARPDPLTIDFSGSAARLEQVDKSVTSGITIKPAIKGSWRWESDSELIFTPSEEWAIGQKYTVRFERTLFPEHVLLATYEYEFNTPRFTASIEDSKFYIDPTDPKIKQVVATVSFSHSVDKSSFERKIHLKLGPINAKPDDRSGEEIPFEISYDKFAGEAYIHSASLPIPVKDRNMHLTIDEGIKAQRGGPAYDNELRTDVTVPGMFSFFHVNSAEPTLARDEHNNPQQIIVVEVSDGVLEKELNDRLAVYQLPQDRPAMQGQPAQSNYGWWNEAEIGPEVLAVSKRLKLEPLPTEHEYDQLHSYRYEAEPGRRIYIRLGKGIKSYGGYQLAEDYDTVATVPDYPRELSFQYEGTLLSLSGHRKLSLVARGLEAVRFEVARVLPSQLNNLISQTGGRFNDPSFNNWNFNADNITERFDEVRTLQPLPPSQAQYTALDLGTYLKSSDGSPKRGIFFVHAQGWDPKNKRTTTGVDRRFILVTNLGLLVKDNADDSHDVFVMNIDSGRPAVETTVQVLGKNGLPLVKATTDGDGHAHIPSLKGMERERAPVAYVAQRGEDLSFLPFDRDDRRLNLSQFDVGGAYTDTRDDTLSAYLFSDRGLYRPGDTFHVASIIKANDWKRTLSGVPLEMTVTDPRGLTIVRRKFTLSASGFETLDYTTEESSPTGEYQVNLFLNKDKYQSSLLGSTTVRVEEFLPDQLTISAHFSLERAEGWVSPEDLKARIDLKNLYGTAASGRRVTAMMSLSPAQPVFRRYKEYRFQDPLQAKHNFDQQLPEATTDENGEAVFDLDLKRFEKGSYRLALTSAGYAAEGGRGVTAERSIMVSPLAFLVGFKADGNLAYISRGGARSVHLLAIDPKLEPMAVSGLQAQLVEQRYVSVLTRQSDGTYRYQSVRKETTLSKQPLNLPAKGLNYSLPTDKPGDYVLVVRDGSDTELNRISFSVVGAANLSRTLEKNAELQIKLNKSDYAPGEEIELQIKAPYTGSGVVTIERDRVYAYKWFKTGTTSSTVTIRVPNTLEGNGYVNVSFVRALDSDEVFTSPLSYGVQPFTVSRAQHTNRITLDVPELVRPGKPLTIGYRSTTPGKIIIFAVDEGILQVAEYQTPDPLGYFFRKRALQVTTSQILDQILPEYRLTSEMAAPGGSEDADALGKNLNPFKRKRDKPVAFWSGIIDVGTTQRQVSYDVPDYFAGTLRVMAVAVSDATIGANENRVLARGPFVLTPNVPTFAAPGDTFTVSVTIANSVEESGSNAKVDVDLATSSHLEVVGAARQNLAISEGHEQTTTFQVKAKDQLGSGRLTFGAHLGKESSSRSIELSVRPPVPYMTSINSGHLTDDKIEVMAPRVMYPQFRTREVSASTLPLGLARGLVSYLNKYPYGCTEQLVSQAFPAVVLRNRPEFGYSPVTVESNLQNVLRILRARQNAEGAFGFWAANSHVSDMQSAYAVHFLIEAKERGLAIPDDLLANAMNYMTALAGRDPDTLAQARDSAYAIYLLTRNGTVTTRYIDGLRKRLDEMAKDQWHHDLSGVLMAATYRMLKLDRDADKVLDGVHFGEAQQSDYANMYDGLVRDALYLDLLARHFPERLPKVSANDLMQIANPIMHGNFNTLSSAYTILALDAYASAVGTPQQAQLKFEELLGKNKLHPLTVPSGMFPQTSLGDDATGVRISVEGKQPIFYQLTEAGFDHQPPAKEIKQRIEVQREYRNSKGDVVTKAALGEELEVHVKVRTIGGEYINNVAVVDLLPGGFDPVIERIRKPIKAKNEDGEDSAESESDNSEDSAEGESDGGEESSESENETVVEAPVDETHWVPDYVDMREDRMVMFGTIGPKVQEFVYRMRAANRGRFEVPPPFAEGMYDRTVQARGTLGVIEITAP